MRTTGRRREPGQTHEAPSPLHRSSNPVLALQRSIGNRAVAQMLAREPARTGSVQIPGVGAIKVSGGNLEEWAGTGAPNWVDVTSKKGKHSAKLEKLSKDRTRVDIKVTIAPGHAEGEQLNVGGGIQLEIKGARIKRYSIDDGVETWRIDDFTDVHRTKITHTVGT